MAWHAKEVVRSIYDHTDPGLALEFVTLLGYDLQGHLLPARDRQLGAQSPAGGPRSPPGTQAHVSNGPTEAANNLIKRVKRVAFGFTSFWNYRIRTLLYAGKPHWALLPTITPR